MLKKKVVSGVGLMFVLFTVSVFGQQNKYQNEIAKWRTNHETELKNEDGWLTVAGLFWLKDGANICRRGRGLRCRINE